MTLAMPSFLIFPGDIDEVHLRPSFCNMVEQPHEIQTGYSCLIRLAPNYALHMASSLHLLQHYLPTRVLSPASLLID